MKKLYISLLFVVFTICSIWSFSAVKVPGNPGSGYGVSILDSSFPSQNYVLANSPISTTVTICNSGFYLQLVRLNFYLLDSSGAFHLIDSDQFPVASGTSQHVESGNIPSNLYSGYVDYYFTLEINGSVVDTKTYSSVFVVYSHQESFNSITWEKANHGCTSCYEDYGCDILKFGANSDSSFLYTSGGILNLKILNEALQPWIDPTDQSRGHQLRGANVDGLSVLGITPAQRDQIKEPGQPGNLVIPPNYGYYAARIQMKLDDDYANGNFWLRGDKGSTSITMECFRIGSTYHIFCNLWNQGVHRKIKDKIVSNPGNGYHEFGIEWMPDHVKWFYDGNEIAHSTSNDISYIPQQGMWPVLGYWMNPKAWWDSNLNPGCDMHYDGTPALYMKVDWVRW